MYIWRWCIYLGRTYRDVHQFMCIIIFVTNDPILYLTLLLFLSLSPPVASLSLSLSLSLSQIVRRTLVGSQKPQGSPVPTFPVFFEPLFPLLGDSCNNLAWTQKMTHDAFSCVWHDASCHTHENASSHTHTNESCHTYEHESFHTCEWIVSHCRHSTRISFHAVSSSWVTSHIWMSHVTHMIEACLTYEWMSHVTLQTYMPYQLHTVSSPRVNLRIWEWVMSLPWLTHVTHMHESCHTYEWVTSHTWMSHHTHMNESCHTADIYAVPFCRLPFCRSSEVKLLTWEWVTSHTWMSHVTLQAYMPY